MVFFTHVTHLRFDNDRWLVVRSSSDPVFSVSLRVTLTQASR